MRKKVVAFLLASAMVFSTVACGGNGNTTDNTDKNTTGSAAENTTNDEQNNDQQGDRSMYPGTEEEGAITFNLASEPPDMCSLTTTDATSGNVLRQIMEPLVCLDEHDEPTEGVATKWEVSDDGLTYTFTLREGMKWTNGEPVTAHDFEYAWKEILNPETAAEYAYFAYVLKNGEAYNNGSCSADEVGVKATSDYELVVTLENPTAYFVKSLSFYSFYPLNQKAYEEYGDKYGTDADKIVTNGAFTMKEWKHQNEIVLEKNPDFYNADKVGVDKIYMLMMENTSTTLNSFQTGEADIVGLSGDQSDLLESEGFDVFNYNDGACAYLEYNLNNKYLANENLRLALGAAIDASVIAENVIKNGTKAPTGFTPEAILGLEKPFPEEVGQTIIGYDPDKAKELYDKAVEELGEVPKLTIITDDGDAAAKSCTFIQEEIKKNLGLEVEIQQMTFKNRLARMTAKDFDIIMALWGPDYNDPMTFLDLWETNGGNNHTGWSNKEYDELLSKIRKEADEKERMNYLYEAEKLVMAEQPVSPIYWRSKAYAVSDKIESGVVRTAFQDINLKYVQLRK